MAWLIDRLTEPLSSGLVLRALVVLAIVGIVCGALGSVVVVRGLAFTGEAFAHTVFPGAVVASLLGWSVAAGALVFGLASAALIALAARVDRVGEETAVGVVFVGAFALGVVILATAGGPGQDLESFLFGSPLGVGWGELALTAGAACVALLGLAAIWRPLVMTSYDPSAAAAAGVRTGLVDGALLVLLALAVVIALGAVGNVLVLAMLITPAATARLIARRMLSTAVLAAGLGTLAGVVGLYVSYYAGVAVGGSVVLSATAILVLVVAARALRPRGGSDARPWWRGRDRPITFVR